MSSIIGQALHYQQPQPMQQSGVMITAAHNYDSGVNLLLKWRDAVEPQKYTCINCRQTPTDMWVAWNIRQVAACELLNVFGEV